MADIVQTLNHSIIQHGPYNKRIYLMKFDSRDMPDIMPVLDTLARKMKYEKILVKTPAGFESDFINDGYHREAVIPGYYQGREDVFFMAKFLSEHRQTVKDRARIDEILFLVRKRRQGDSAAGDRNPRPNVRSCRPEDAEEMGRLYGDVFKTYPFPIYDPDYLARNMNDHTVYFCVRDQGRIVALSAVEMDLDNQSVEMTDFATLDEFRSQGLAGCLLSEMEALMHRRGMRTAFSIARSLSPGMNITFVRNGYLHGGTLDNNTNIAGRIESMHVWYKRL